MSAVSSSLEPIPAGSTKLPWVAPISTFLLVGVNQTFASFDLNFWALLLLLACGALGAGLQLIPQKAKAWDPPPTSSQATLKQTIVKTRILVYVSLIVLPGIIFMTGEPFRKRFPPQVDNYISDYVKGKKNRNLYVFLPKERENVQQAFFYVGKYEPAPKMSETNGVGRTGINLPEGAGMKGELYVVPTAKIIEDIFNEELLPKIYLVLTGLVAVVAIFIFAIFFMEIVGGMMCEREQRAR